MDKVQKHNLFNTNTALSESYKNYCIICKGYTASKKKHRLLWLIKF